MTTKMKGCIFCDWENKALLAESENFYAIYDQYPVTPLHALVISKNHFYDYYVLEEHMMVELHEMAVAVSGMQQINDKTISGWNIGFNSGPSAGQTIRHFHLHVIPRRDGDMEDPRGGIRGCIPEKRIYD